MFKILIVEDDRELNRSVCSFLSQSGYEAVGCLSAEEAFDAMYENVFDLIVSDIMMPNIDGFEFVKSVRELDKNIPILFMTARDDFAAKQRGYRVGIDDYMVKPIDLDELFLRIGALLRRAKIASSRKLEVGNFEMDADEHTAYLNGEEISSEEFEKLRTELTQVMTAENLFDVVTSGYFEIHKEAAEEQREIYNAYLSEKLYTPQMTYYEIEHHHRQDADCASGGTDDDKVHAALAIPCGGRGGGHRDKLPRSVYAHADGVDRVADGEDYHTRLHLPSRV